MVCSSSADGCCGGGRSSLGRLGGVAPASASSVSTALIAIAAGVAGMGWHLRESLNLLSISSIWQNCSVCGFAYGITAHSVVS